MFPFMKTTQGFSTALYPASVCLDLIDWVMVPGSPQLQGGWGRGEQNYSVALHSILSQQPPHPLFAASF